MRVLNVDEFVKDARKSNEDFFYSKIKDTPYIDEEFSNTYTMYKAINIVLDAVEKYKNIFEVEEIAKDITYPRGCDETDIDCEECEHHRSVSWCSRAIKDHGNVNPAYEEGWMDGVEAAEKQLNGYDTGYADGWDDGWTECLESVKIAMNKVFEDNK